MTKLKYNAPFLMVLMLISIYHIIINVNFGDDVEYFLNFSNTMDFFDFIKWRYSEWSSRVIIDAAVYYLIRVIPLWKIINTLMISTIPFFISKILNADAKAKYFICFVSLLLPISIISSAGWIATSANYLWPVWCALTLGYFIHKYYNNNIQWFYYILSIPLLLFACNMELCSALVLCIIILAIIISFYNKKYNVYYLYMLLGLSIISILFVFLCPGNQIRNHVESASRGLEYDSYSFFDKTIIGVVNTEYNIISIFKILFVLFCVVLLLGVFTATKLKSKRIISVVLLFTCLLSITLYKFGVFEKSIAKLYIFLKIPELALCDVLLTILYCISFVLIIVLSLIIFENNAIKLLSFIMLFMIGNATAVVMGFSPTIYTSGYRVFIYSLIVLFYLISMIFIEIENKSIVLFSKYYKLDNILMITVIVLAVYKYVNSLKILMTMG